MALRTYEQWKRGEEPEITRFEFPMDVNPEEIIRDEIDKEIIDDLKKAAGAGGLGSEVLDWENGQNGLPLEIESMELPLEIESMEITAKPRKFSKVNLFTEQDWCKIKGIGSKLAKKLFESRPYMSVDEIAKIKGVGKAVLENIKVTLLDENQQAEE